MKIGKFWVVTKAARDSVMDDILFEVDAAGLVQQGRGGLLPGHVVGAWTERAEALRAAEEALRTRKASSGDECQVGPDFIRCRGKIYRRAR